MAVMLSFDFHVAWKKRPDLWNRFDPHKPGYASPSSTLPALTVVKRVELLRLVQHSQVPGFL